MKEDLRNAPLQKKRIIALYVDVESIITLQALANIYKHSESEIAETAIKFLYSNYHCENIEI